MTPEERGAVDYRECPKGGGAGRCRCGICAVCGFPKHSALHCAFYGQPAGSKPFDHAYVPKEEPK